MGPPVGAMAGEPDTPGAEDIGRRWAVELARVREKQAEKLSTRREWNGRDGGQGKDG